MSIADRFKAWIDSLAEGWKDRLRGWMASWVVKGTMELFDAFEPDLRAEIKPMLLRMREIEGLPDDFKNIIDKATEEKSAIQFVAILPYLIGILIGLGMGAAAPVSRIGSYQIDKIIKSYRLDPISVITAWRRDPKKYEKFFADLKDQGWHDDRIEALKFFTLFMPSAGDIVTWYAREVYEPDMIERYGLASELPEYEKTDFPKIGVDAKQARNFWMAHWEHASYMQIREMIHRGVLSLDKEMPEPPTTKEGWAARDAEGTKAAYDWYRLVEIPPFWRARLTEMMFEIPTRVDVRRFWDMRTIDEERLRSIYHSQGYHGKDLDDYVLWTKVYVAFPDLIARWKNGWITEEDVRSELTGYGMPADRLEELIQTKIKTTEPERVSEELDLTKAEICAGVKKGVISWEEGLELLQDIGKSREEAEFILEVKIGAAAGSPETYPEFKEWTQRFRKAAGMPARIPTEELKQAAAEVVKLTRDLEALKAAVKEEEGKLIGEEVLPAAATARRDELRVTLHRAEAALELARSSYARLLAEWRHKAE